MKILLSKKNFLIFLSLCAEVGIYAVEAHLICVQGHLRWIERWCLNQQHLKWTALGVNEAASQNDSLHITQKFLNVAQSHVLQ